MLWGKTKLNSRWLISCLFLLNACHEFHGNQQQAEVASNYDSNYTCIRQTELLIHSGDIITRTGNDFTSYCLKKLNQREKLFSHCGIASIEHDSIFVYHAIGGDFNPDQKIKRELFASFVNPYANNEFGIFRMKVSEKNIELTISAAKDYFKRGIKFDMDFDINTDDRMYCAEFVAKSIEKGNQGMIKIPVSHIREFVFYGVDDIILLEGMKKIFCFNYFKH